MFPEGALLPKGRVLSTKASLSLLYMNHHPPTPPHSPTSPHQVMMQVIFCLKHVDNSVGIKSTLAPHPFFLWTIRKCFAPHTNISSLIKVGRSSRLCKQRIAYDLFSTGKENLPSSHLCKFQSLTEYSLVGFPCNRCSSASSPRTGWIRPLPPSCTSLPRSCPCTCIPCTCPCLPCPCSSCLS